MNHEDRADVVVAVIAAFCPKDNLADTVRALAEQVSHVVVVDDGSPDGSEDVLTAIEATGATVLRQKPNAGIAATLNAGVHYAEKTWDPTYFLTLDQDSTVTGRYVELALTCLTEAGSADLEVGFVCAAAFSGHATPKLTPQLRRGGGPEEAFDPMQSGFFIPRSTWQRVGYFAESFFIDGVDSDFTMRCRDAGLRVVIGRGCTIEHDLGERGRATLFGRRVSVFGRDISYNYHSPSRIYYICRNGTVLSRRYALKAPGWVARRLLEESKAHILRLLFSPGRRTLAMAAAAGFRDALNGRMGRMPASLEHRLH